MRVLGYCFLLVIHLATLDLADADPGSPIAIRCWSPNCFTIENQWGLKIQVGSHPSDLADQVLVMETDYRHVLKRDENDPRIDLARVGRISSASDANQFLIQSVPASQGGGVLIRTDGVRIRVCQISDWTAPLDGEQQNAKADVLVICQEDAFEPKLNESFVRQVIGTLAPKRIVIAQSSGTKNQRHFADACDSVLEVAHNTTAVSAALADGGQRMLVRMSTEPWQMPAELAEEFAKMESACEESQNVFRPLSANQLNFKPSNGTHTPRWNVEHMMGRQLQFFSQIYHAIDPVIPVRNKNPKQMPPQYVAAHPEWDGDEEARQMQRVSDYCRRYAYLLDGVDLETRAPGSRWPTLRRLLQQMQRHYDEHTANTVKKFELPDYPRS